MMVKYFNSDEHFNLLIAYYFSALYYNPDNWRVNLLIVKILNLYNKVRRDYRIPSKVTNHEARDMRSKSSGNHVTFKVAKLGTIVFYVFLALLPYLEFHWISSVCALLHLKLPAFKWVNRGMSFIAPWVSTITICHINKTRWYPEPILGKTGSKHYETGMNLSCLASFVD